MAMTQLERLYRVADDRETVVLNALAVRAGIMRRCENFAWAIQEAHARQIEEANRG
jgi:hypothetical protein